MLRRAVGKWLFQNYNESFMKVLWRKFYGISYSRENSCSGILLTNNIQ